MTNLFLGIAVTVLSVSALSFTGSDNETYPIYSDANVSFEIPSDVQVIIDNSCYACHNNESRSEKSKDKLNFDQLPQMKISKQVGKLMKISKVVKKGKMPVEEFIEKYPDKALSKEDSERLSSWASTMAGELGGE